MKVEEILQLMEGFSKYQLTKFSMENEEFELSFEKEGMLLEGTPVTRVLSNVPKDNGEQRETPETGTVVKSPLVGTFYQSSSPEEEPFVRVGDPVKKGQVLGIIEAMKLMNEIESEVDGVVTKVLVEDSSVVEFDQPLFVIEEA